MGIMCNVGCTSAITSVISIDYSAVIAVYAVIGVITEISKHLRLGK